MAPRPKYRKRQHDRENHAGACNCDDHGFVIRDLGDSAYQKPGELAEMVMSQIEVPTSGNVIFPLAPPDPPARQEFDFEDFFENGGLALHLVGPDGTILHANKAELRLLGYPTDQYIGRNMGEFHVDPE